MRKHISYLFAVLISAFSLFSCSEDNLEVYNGNDYIHFTPLSNGNALETTYNFAESGTTRETSARVPLEITLWGYLPETDFTYTVSVIPDGTTAGADDFENPSSGTYRAGFPVDTLWVNVKRKEELLATSFTIKLHLDGAGTRSIGPEKYAVATVHVEDKLTKPSWWNLALALRLGEYSDIKYRVFNIYLGKVLTSLNGYTAISFSEEITSFKEWWEDQWNSGNYRYYDTDGKTPLYETIAD